MPLTLDRRGARGVEMDLDSDEPVLSLREPVRELSCLAVIPAERSDNRVSVLGMSDGTGGRGASTHRGICSPLSRR